MPLHYSQKLLSLDSLLSKGSMAKGLLFKGGIEARVPKKKNFWADKS